MPDKREKAQQALEKIMQGKYGAKILKQYFIFCTLLNDAVGYLNPELHVKAMDAGTSYRNDEFDDLFKRTELRRLSRCERSSRSPGSAD